MVDNDVALKVCAYASATDLIDLGSAPNHSLAMLRVARFTIDRRVQRARYVRDPEKLQSQWTILSAAINWIEPTTEEVEFAAELEESAMNLNVDLDGGESQLFAILVSRLSPLLLTGDKRAIVAIETIGQLLPAGRVACLEQVISTVLQKIGVDVLRERICSEPDVDRSLSIAFACHSNSYLVSVTSIEEGLASYVASVQRSAPSIIVPTTDLSAVVS
ncbi:hypothetical protein [Sinorhizobium fredii]|uniref:hypothetical protein n=1 Tax=Rhizobium fredii TaxID=380 RepID=UPI00131A17E6|nr:hypothetical protein [Sinorhizobium fredii]